MNISNWHAYVKMSSCPSKGHILPGFHMATIPDAGAEDLADAERIKRCSREKYGCRVEQINSELHERRTLVQDWQKMKEKEAEDLIRDVFRDDS